MRSNTIGHWPTFPHTEVVESTELLATLSHYRATTTLLYSRQCSCTWASGSLRSRLRACGPLRHALLLQRHCSRSSLPGVRQYKRQRRILGRTQLYAIDIATCYFERVTAGAYITSRQSFPHKQRAINSKSVFDYPDMTDPRHT